VEVGPRGGSDDCSAMLVKLERALGGGVAGNNVDDRGLGLIGGRAATGGEPLAIRLTT
jgi:hypothetical protein